MQLNKIMLPLVVAVLILLASCLTQAPSSLSEPRELSPKEIDGVAEALGELNEAVIPLLNSWKGNESKTQYIVDETVPDSIMDFVQYLKPGNIVIYLSAMDEEDLARIVETCLPDPPAGLLVLQNVIVICAYNVPEERMLSSSLIVQMEARGWIYAGKINRQHIWLVQTEAMSYYHDPSKQKEMGTKQST